VTRLTIELVPQGVIPRDAALTVQMQKTPPAAAVAEPFLAIVTDQPVVVDAYSFFTVYTHDTRAKGLAVTVTSPDVSQIAWLTGSPLAPSFDLVTIVTIPAGASSVEVPFFASSAAESVNVTATAGGYEDAAAVFDIVADLVPPIADIVYDIQFETWLSVAQDGSGGFTVGQGMTDYAPAAGHFGFGTGGFDDVNTYDFDVNLDAFQVAHPGTTPRLDLITVFGRVVLTDGIAMEPARIGWAISCAGGTQPIIRAATDTYGASVAGLQVCFRIYSDVWHFVGGAPIVQGLTFTITCMLDGAPIDNTRTSFTLNIVNNNLL
jgi:hypothetical protein